MKMNPSSQDYAQGNSFQSGIYLHLIQRVIPHLKPGSSILDIGCGDGKSTAILKTRAGPIIGAGGTIIGIDVLPSMVEHANTHYSSRSLPALDSNSSPTLLFAVADISAPLKEIREKLLAIIPKKSRDDIEGDFKFDAIVSSCCLHWVADLPTAFANMRELLKPTGNLHVILGHKPVGALDYGVVQVLKDPFFGGILKDLRYWHEHKMLPWRRDWMKILANEKLDTNPCDKDQDSKFGIANLKNIMGVAGWKSSDELNILELKQLEITDQGSEERMLGFVSGCFPDVLSQLRPDQKTMFFQHFIRFMIIYNTHCNGDPFHMSIPLCLIEYIPDKNQA